MRITADAKAKALESETSILRDEAKELRLLLDSEYDTEEFNPEKENEQAENNFCAVTY